MAKKLKAKPKSKPEPAPQPKRFNAEMFAAVTGHAMDFYGESATEEEKKVIAKAILDAAKAIKKSQKGSEEAEKKKKGRFLPTPQQIAAALYMALADSEGTKVKGDPQDGQRTDIRGEFDLTEVAGKMLAAATGSPLVPSLGI